MIDKEKLTKANLLISLGKLEEALPVAQSLMRLHPHAAAPNFLMGRIELHRKDNARALEFAQKAYEIDRNSAYTASFLAEVYVELNLPEFALPLLKTAYKQFPRDRGLNFILGRCYMLMEKGYLALPHLQIAASGETWTAESTDVALALAECLGAIARPVEANALLDKVIKKDPSRPAALLMRGQTVGKPVPAWLIEQLTGLTVSDDSDTQASAWLALGRCHDVEGRHEEAFECWTRSRSILGVQKFNPQVIARQLQQSRAFYAKPFLDAAAPFGDRNTNPIFVVGMPRSGTTLTTQVISAHPACINIGETNRFGRYDLMFRQDFWRETGQRDILQGAKGGLLRNIAKEYNTFFSVFAEGSKTRVVEKTPFNFEHIGFIRLIYPTARFVYCRRHPADNFVSAFQHSMNRSHDYSYGQESYVERYLAHEELMRHWKSCFPDQIFELRYEDMVADQERMSRKLIAFCGLAWDDACLNFHEQKSTVRTFSQAQVRQPVYASSVERWRRYERHLGPLFAKLNQHGYDYATRAL